MTWLILLLTFGASAVTTYVMVAPSGEAMLVKNRVAALRRGPGLRRTAQGTVINEEMELPFTQRVLGPMLDRFYQWIIKRTPTRVQASVQLRLIQAGQPMGPSHYIGLQTLFASGLALAGLLISSPFMGQKPVAAGGLMLVLLGAGWRLPEFWLSRMISQRRRLIDKSLPDVLDLLSVSVEAGLGLDGAIQKVGEKFPEPISGEFRELLKAIRLGTARADALPRPGGPERPPEYAHLYGCGDPGGTAGRIDLPGVAGAGRRPAREAETKGGGAGDGLAAQDALPVDPVHLPHDLHCRFGTGCDQLHVDNDEVREGMG